MKKVAKVLLVASCSIISLLMSLIVLTGIYFGVKGYQMYREATEHVPIREKVETIQQQEGFTQFEELPDIYIQAVIAVEDKRFWDHQGVDYLAIARAVWQDLKAGALVEGGSTITQQLMKNEYFTQDKTWERKFAEIFAAWELEKECSKEEIFELYVNTIYFGSGYYGIYDAAEGYFHKTPQALSGYEAVMLAGLPNAPSVYSPDTNPELAKQRMRQVLSRMVACGVMDQEEASQILAPAS